VFFLIFFAEANMVTCFIRYVVDLDKITEFEKYARTWINLVEEYGVIHHGYFLPGQNFSAELDQAFSFPTTKKRKNENYLAEFVLVNGAPIEFIQFGSSRTLKKKYSEYCKKHGR
jgi:hypothetical protein